MPDYGHPLRFGSFITPVNARPQHPVDLAMISEDAGLDLVTFQDHPYQAAFHDTWTLLSWVAARTSRIHVSGNVLNLPLRQPAVLARSAASLDLLSDGRFELGLGAGGFVDAIASMGGPRRTAGEHVSALDEAIDVIRGIWDADERAILRLDGAFYQLEGAKRGPAPAHDIPIWVGAVKPRMQRLIGRKGDGWLPSLPYLQPGDLERGNQTIDEAAVRAGRDPREITRLLNVSPRESAEELARLAIDDGASVFILASDDPRELRRFAEETAAEVRERVGEAREASGVAGGAGGAGGGAGGVVEGVFGGVRPDRPVPAIDGDAVPDSLAPHALVTGDRDYRRYTSSYFRGAAPALVLRPQDAAQVQDAVRYAARHRDVPLGLFSGGHGLSGRSLNDGGIVIALGALNEITVEGSRVRVGPGATWRRVAQALAPHGLALTSGDYGGVGVGGLATAGGLGWFVREHGLTIDRLRAVEVVTADGSLVRASADEEPELFWAMRGAGANFGVAVAFEFEAHPIGEHVGFAMLQFVPDDVATFFTAWGDAIEAAHESVTGTLIAVPGAPGTPTVVQALLVVDSQEPDLIVERLQPFADLAPLADQSVQLAPYSALLDLGGASDAQHGQGEPVSHSGLVRHLTPEVAAGVANLLGSGSSMFLSIRSAGGAAGRVPADATAYAWRDANFNIAAINGRSPEAERRWADLLPHFEGSYLSFETDTGPDAVARAFPPAHLARLRALKRVWDPAGLFRDNFFIDPAGE